MLARNAFICVHLICSGSNLLLDVQISVPWSVGLVGTVGQVLRCDWSIKDCKLDLSSEGKIGKTNSWCISYINEIGK
jgi:hypothetical protein